MSQLTTDKDSTTEIGRPVGGRHVDGTHHLADIKHFLKASNLRQIIICTSELRGSLHKRH
jgi:hypothetical protein